MAEDSDAGSPTGSDTGEEYVVEKILEKRIVGGKVEYLLKVRPLVHILSHLHDTVG